MFRVFRVSVVSVVVFVATVGSGVLQAPVASCEIVLNEVLADPASDWNGDGGLSSRDDEWVEIYNPGPSPIDLAGYRLAGPDSVWRFEFSGVLMPGQVRVVYGSESYAWETANGFPAFGLRLSNTGGEIDLFRVGPSLVTRIDGYVYKDHEADDDRASGRGPDGGPNWILLDGMFPWTGTALPAGSLCMPTPGARMSCPTATKAVTWGAVKAGVGE